MELESIWFANRSQVEELGGAEPENRLVLALHRQVGH